MRQATPAIWFAIFALAPACFSTGHTSSPPDAGQPDGDSGGSGGTTSSGGCSPSSGGLGGGPPPSRLYVPRLGAGLVSDVFYTPPADHPMVTVASSDPRIVEVSIAGPVPAAEDFRVAAHAVGTATLTTLDASTGAVVDTAAVTVVAVDQIAVRLRVAPGADQPITAAAGLAGSTDAVRVAFYAADGVELQGSGTFNARGSLSLPTDATLDQLSDLLLPGTQVLISFGASGSGQLVIGLFDGDKQLVVPFDIVAAPAQLAMITFSVAQVFQSPLLATTTIPVGLPAVTSIIGRTADGRLVAGVTATWSAQLAGTSLLTDSGPTSEQIYTPPTAGSFDITATIGAQTVSQRLTAQ